MENILPVISYISFILLVLGFWKPNASLFWFPGIKNKQKSVLIYLPLLAGSLVLFVPYALEDEEAATKVVYDHSDKSIREAQTITANNLLSFYLENEVSADNRFKGKKFYIEGFINDIGKDIGDEIYLTLKTDHSIRTIQCFTNENYVVAGLKRGQKVTLFGRCDGMLMNVFMYDCTIVADKEQL